MEAHAVSEDFRNHFKSDVSGDFKLRLTFSYKKSKASDRFKTITLSFSWTTLSQRDVQIKRNFNVHISCPHRKFTVKLEHESLCPFLYTLNCKYMVVKNPTT